MRIDRNEIGSITVDGKTYVHDVMIGLSGRVSKRRRSCRSSNMEHRTSSPRRKRKPASRRDAMWS